jgi:hypothetical protein
MVDLQSHKLQVHPTLNVNPSYDIANGNNGTNLIVKHNSLTDTLQSELNNINPFVEAPDLSGTGVDNIYLNRGLLSVVSNNIIAPNSMYSVLSAQQGWDAYVWNTTNTDYAEIYFDINKSTKTPFIYIEKYTNADTQFAFDYAGDLTLSGIGYNEKIKLSIINNGEIYIGGSKVLESQKTVIPDLNVTATNGILPTPTQNLTINNTSTPTVVELLKYCTELNVQITDLKTKLKSHGLIV